MGKTHGKIGYGLCGDPERVKFATFNPIRVVVRTRIFPPVSPVAIHIQALLA